MMLGYQKGRYEMPAHNLGRVREIMSSRGNAFTGRHGPASGKEKNENSGPLAGKKTSRNKPSLGEAFEKLVNTRWFGEGKTISQLKEKLEEMAVIVPTSRLPVYLLKAVGSKPQRLTRNKVDIDGKKVWLYSTK